MRYRRITLILIFFCLVIAESCVSKVYPDEKLAIDSDFLALFNSIAKNDTFSFKNSAGDQKIFIITKVDSIISNEKGWFINETPYKLLKMDFKQIGNNTVKLERNNEVFVNKNPETNLNSIGIQFNNFFFNDTILPPLQTDTLNELKLSSYYLFETLLSLKNPNDIKVLYMNKQKGFVGFKTLSNEIWVNEMK